jgi:hypothetical protein
MNVSENGWWLLARLAVHHEYNRGLARFKQETLGGPFLRYADQVEVARLELALAEARNPFVRVEENNVVYLKRKW